MSMTMGQQSFSWPRVRDLFGVPYHDSHIQELFSDVNLTPDSLWREVRVGIYSMSPYDRRPSPITEIDLIPSYHVRIRFKQAQLLVDAKTESPTTFVLAAVTYFLENETPEERFVAELPFGILGTDDLDKIAERVGSPATDRVLDENDGYVQWKDRNPVLHVLFSVREKRPLRINVFLAEKSNRPV